MQNQIEKRIVTLDDIAERLGTSKNTVSRALRDCSDIGAAMKERVKQTAMEMGYVPNKIAGFLRSKRSNIIAVAVNSLTNPFFAICMDHCTDYMGEKGYRPLISIMREELDVARNAAFRAARRARSARIRGEKHQRAEVEQARVRFLSR